MRSKLYQCMQDHDRFVVEFQYLDSKGKLSIRVASPIRFLPNGRFLAMCLSREEPRQFYLVRCRKMELRRAEDYVMPVPITEVVVPGLVAVAGQKKVEAKTLTIPQLSVSSPIGNGTTLADR